jgi:hypothetical protein
MKMRLTVVMKSKPFIVQTFTPQYYLVNVFLRAINAFLITMKSVYEAIFLFVLRSSFGSLLLSILFKFIMRL